MTFSQVLRVVLRYPRFYIWLVFFGVALAFADGINLWIRIPVVILAGAPLSFIVSSAVARHGRSERDET